MTTISNVSSASSYGYNFPAANVGGSLPAQTSDAGLVQSAVSLSSQGSIVASLGGGSSSPVTYDAAGLLNSLVQAGTPPSTALTVGNNANPQTTAQNSTNQAIVSAMPSAPATSGIYNSSGPLQSLPSNTSANWANALKANPNLASVVASDSLNQGIVGTLSTTA